MYETFENSGVLIFAMQDLFTKISEIENSQRDIQFQIKLSYIEIYNEVIYDLLCDNN